MFESLNWEALQPMLLNWGLSPLESEAVPGLTFRPDEVFAYRS